MFQKIKVVVGLTLIPVLSVFAGAMLSDAPSIDQTTHIPLGVFITGISITAGLAYAATKAYDNLMGRIKSLEITMNQLYCVRNEQCLRDKEAQDENNRLDSGQTR